MNKPFAKKRIDKPVFSVLKKKDFELFKPLERFSYSSGMCDSRSSDKLTGGCIFASLFCYCYKAFKLNSCKF